MSVAANRHPLVEKVRAQCLKRGASGIKGIGRTFRIFDDDRNHQLNLDEMKTGLADYGVTLTDAEFRELFSVFDEDGSGNVNFDEFLVAIRPPMGECRINILKKAYQKFDKTGDGVITMKDLKGVYNCREHPKYKNGEWTEAQVFGEFVKNYDSNNDSKVTWEEFLNYYAGVSANIDNDAYFDLMIRNSWKI